MARGKDKPDGQIEEAMDNLSVHDRLLALKTLFSKWALGGVPPGVVYPKSLRALLKWTCPEHGIATPIGSKRDLSKKSSEYKVDVQAIDALLKDLHSSAKLPPKRVYKTQKAKRVRAEDQTKLYKTLLDGVTKQWEEVSEELEGASRDLFAERHQNGLLRKEVDELKQENALLKRKLASKDTLLTVISS